MKPFLLLFTGTPQLRRARLQQGQGPGVPVCLVKLLLVYSWNSGTLYQRLLSVGLKMARATVHTGIVEHWWARGDRQVVTRLGSHSVLTS